VNKNFISMPVGTLGLLELRWYGSFCKSLCDTETFFVTQKRMTEHIVFPVADTTKEAANKFCYACEMQHDVLDMHCHCRKLGARLGLCSAAAGHRAKQFAGCGHSRLQRRNATMARQRLGNYQIRKVWGLCDKPRSNAVNASPGLRNKVRITKV